MSPARKSAPSITAIARYWSDEGSTFYNVAWERPGCFACGYLKNDGEAGDPDYRWQHAGLQRCHLIAHAAGGSVALNNLVLLCGRCHADAPMVGRSVQPMIDWINRRESWCHYVFRRLMEECNAIDPLLLQRVQASAWRPTGETSEDRIENFIAKMDLMANFLQIDFPPGGEPFATVAAVVGAMGKLDFER